MFRVLLRWSDWLYDIICVRTHFAVVVGLLFSCIIVPIFFICYLFEYLFYHLPLKLYHRLRGDVY